VVGVGGRGRTKQKQQEGQNNNCCWTINQSVPAQKTAKKSTVSAHLMAPICVEVMLKILCVPTTPEIEN
jgi:hypothetical protein